MDKYTITRKIEKFAPLETQEKWDCSGWLINLDTHDCVNKIMLCLTPSEDIINQARNHNCDMIISHHPCFHIPLSWSDINIYCAHTNLDKAQNGTTDTLIDKLGLSDYKLPTEHEFLRVIKYKTTIENFNKKIKKLSSAARIINNNKIFEMTKIAFCAGSGSEFINDAVKLGADCLVTGDLKFHTALDAQIVVYDIGHFESEILVLPVIEKLIKKDVEVIYAKEKSPFTLIT